MRQKAPMRVCVPGLHVPNTHAQHKLPKAGIMLLAHCCCAKRAESLPSATAVTPMHVCLSKWVCKCLTPMHSTLGQSRTQSRTHAFLLIAALQQEQTAALCHCSHTYASLPSQLACRCTTLMHSTSCSKQETCFLAHCCSAKRAHSSLVLLQSH